MSQWRRAGIAIMAARHGWRLRKERTMGNEHQSTKPVPRPSFWDGALEPARPRPARVVPIRYGDVLRERVRRGESSPGHPGETTNDSSPLRNGETADDNR